MSAKMLFAVTLLCGSVFGQSVTGNLLGTITDPGDAAIPGVQVEIKDMATAATRTVSSGAEGIFRFTNLSPSTYTITVKADGFKTYTQQNIVLTANETRDLGRIPLTLGSLTEEVSVTAQITPVQTASSEKSALVDSNQMLDLTLKGRDFFGLLVLIPGVTITATETTDGFDISTISVNGSGSARTNYQVDGVLNLDPGCNSCVNYVPNMDTVAEVRVLTSNYQAEYGRNVAGTVSVVTKGGTQQFHGSGWANKRHEMFNAKNFFENFNNQQKSVYRFFVGGFSVGGPVYVPKKFNSDKKKLFFFVSQEYTRQKPGTTNIYAKMPTAAMRAGDFSADVDQNGKLIQLYDPTTRAAIPNNKLSPLILDPVSAAFGQAALNFFPLPNRCDIASNANGTGCYTEGDSSQLNRRNYYDMFYQTHPRRNDSVRFDFNLTSKMTGWARWIHDYDLWQTSGNYELKNSLGKWSPYFEDHPFPGHTWGVGIIYTITPTMVNEVTFGKNYNTWDWYAHDPGQLARANMNNPPSFNDFAKDPNFINDVNLERATQSPGSQNYAIYVPSVSFGGGSTVGEASFSSSRPYTNWDNNYNFNESVSKVWGTHNLKAGLYFERNEKIQQGGNGAYLGSYSFGSSSSFPQDTGDGYANAYLGNTQTYSEGGRRVGDFWYTNWEAFVQDNWRISKRVTIDLGVRFSHFQPYVNTNNFSATFVRSTYDAAQAYRLYYPICTVPTTTTCPTANQKAYDPVTGFTTYPALAGTFVPYSAGGYTTQPNYAPGMQVADGKNPNVPYGLFTWPAIVPAFRVGVAWDVFGNGKTAIRTGFGQFFNSPDGNQIFGMNGNPPLTLNKSVYYLPISGVPNYVASAAVSPQAPTNMITGNQKDYEGLMNASFGVQRSIGFSTVLDVSYVGSFRRHFLQARQLNAVPIYSQYNPSYYSPWNAGLYANASGKALSDNYFRPLPGLGGLTWSNYEGSSNFHSLQASVRRNMSRGLSYGLSYTFSKTMSASASPYWPDKYRNYGPSFQGAPQIAVINYAYDVPGLGKKLNFKPLGWVTDNWTISGITQVYSHGHMGVPGWSFTGTTTLNPSPNFTGSAEGARAIVLGNSTIPMDQVTFYHTFDPTMTGIPMPCSWTPAATPQYGIGQSMACFGNAGAGSLITIPTKMNNWDMTFGKNFPLKSEKRVLLFRAEMYNVFNHTQFSGINSTIQYDLSNWQKGILVPSNTQLGRFTSARNPRQMSMSLRFQF